MSCGGGACAGPIIREGLAARCRPRCMTPSALANTPQLAPGPEPLIAEPKPLSPAPPVVVRADGLGKRFRIYERPLDRLWEWLGRKTRAGKPLHADFWAVRGVS